MSYNSSRRIFMKQAGLLLAGAQLAPWMKFVSAADLENVVSDTSTGKIRGVVVDGIKVFKGIPYGASTSGKNRFMPPVKPVAWTGTRDALAFGPTAPQGGDNSGTGGGISGAAERRLSGAERLHAGAERRTQASGDGLAARRRIFQRFRLRPHSRRHQPRAHARRRRRDASIIG